MAKQVGWRLVEKAMVTVRRAGSGVASLQQMANALRRNPDERGRGTWHVLLTFGFL